MSELINTRGTRTTIRWKLLTSVSALALTATVSTMAIARAEDADRPLIWIELGGQMENVSGQGEAFAPAFLAANPTSSVLWKGTSPLEAQRPPRDFGEESEISFQPEGSDWVFSAAARIGRSSNYQHTDHQTPGVFFERYKYGAPFLNTAPHVTENFADTQAHHHEDHAIVDFSAGKDVGLGLFGSGSSSVLNFGVRFAQFASGATLDIRARPDLRFKDESFPSLHFMLHEPYFHTYHATGNASRSFRGIGPSLSWSGSTPFVGNQQDGEIAIDWGANAAILFGRQRSRVQHQETAYYGPPHLGNYASARPFYSHPPAGHNTNRSVAVPNLGGFAGISYRYNNAKISLGYRADFFFGAMDTGIDAVKKSNATFNGPYASISFGLGD